MCVCIYLFIVTFVYCIKLIALLGAVRIKQSLERNREQTINWHDFFFNLVNISHAVYISNSSN